MSVTHASHEHVDPLKSYILVFVTLMVLLLITVGAYYLPFEKWFGEQWGFLNTMVALIIATIKATLVILVFMHLRHGTKLTWVIAASGFIWLCIMIMFFFADYLSRGAIPEVVHGTDEAARTITIPQAVHRDLPAYNGNG